MPRANLTSEERERVSRFWAAFNVIEQSIRKRFPRSRANLNDLIDTLAARHPEWKQRDRLRQLAVLRNDLAHANGTEDLRAVPTEGAIAELRKVLNSVRWLSAVGQRFNREVECVRSTDNLTDVLHLVRVRDYSQFPVLDGSKLSGLITENGVTRWLAKNFRRAERLNALEAVFVGDLLRSDENRQAYELVPVSLSIEAAIERMSGKPDLEALLITKNGVSLPLQGIVTRWDVLQVLREHR